MRQPSSSSRCGYVPTTSTSHIGSGARVARMPPNPTAPTRPPRGGRGRSRRRRPSACSRRTCAPTPRTRRRTGRPFGGTLRGRRPSRSGRHSGGRPPRPGFGAGARALLACRPRPDCVHAVSPSARLDKTAVFRQWRQRRGSRDGAGVVCSLLQPWYGKFSTRCWRSVRSRLACTTWCIRRRRSSSSSRPSRSSRSPG